MNKYILFLSTLLTTQISSQNIFNKIVPSNDVSEKKVLDEIEKKTKDCVKYEGLFNFYQNTDNGKSYIEIDSSHLDEEFIHFSYIENGILDAWAFQGSYRGSKIIKISKHYDNIEISVENTKYFYDTVTALSKSAGSNINKPIIVSEKILAKNKDKSKFLISADNIFLSESLKQIKASYPGSYRGFRLGNLSKKTRYDKIRNYPENTDVVVNYFYESRYPSSGGSDAVTDARNISILVQHSLVKMPDNNFKPRNDDTRVGYFNTQTNNMTSLDRVNYRDFINRWRLEKKNPELEISEPIKPIVYWVENTTPIELREIVKNAIESWNSSFEKAGFKNAIVAKIQPDTADWDAGDIRYNVLRWNSSPQPPFSGYGPSFVNPKTGEILGADIMLEWTYITNRIFQNNLFNDKTSEFNDEFSKLNQFCCNASHIQANENQFGLSYLSCMSLSDELKKDLLRQSLYRLVLHEVGHTLGLSHNFKGSTLLSTTELNNKSIVNERGVCSSVMDYPAINIAKDPDNQGLFFDVKPGVYDDWAIQFGYSQFPDSLENQSINNILSRSTEKDLAFANDAFDMRSPGKGTDPDAMIYDLSNDQINFSLQKIQMSTDILKNIKEKSIEKNDTYEELYRSYLSLVYSYFQSLEVVTRQIGGVKVDLSHTDQKSSRKPFESVDYETQKKAMNMISKYGFSNKVVLQPEIFPYLQKQRRGWSISKDPTIHQRILIYQSRLLNHLLHPNVLQRITNSSLYGNEYKLPEYMIDLSKSIFQSDMNGNVTTVRQNLQISFINRLLSIIGEKSKYDNVSKTSAHYNLNWLKDNLNINTGDLASRQHKSYILFLIEDSLVSR